MNTNRMSAVFATLLLSFFTTSSMAMDHHEGGALKALAEGDHRSEMNKSRNKYRHSVETLEYFGIKPDMTVVEISPGGGWYTEIIAPFLNEGGKLYASSYDPSLSKGRADSVRMLQEKLDGNADYYSGVTLNVFEKGRYDLAPRGTADMVLTFRNLHNWMEGGYDKEALQAIFETLKPGGIFGFVDHRGKASIDAKDLMGTGYVGQDYIIALAKDVGFDFVGSSEINANSKDTKDYPEGVWTLPPTYELEDKDRAQYKAIGESDRMTLKFRKPE